MGSLDRRIQQLEEVYHASPPGSLASLDPEARERRAALVESMQLARAKAEREEAKGYPQRRRALEQLIESMKRRASIRRRSRGA
jgi:hypothetical protein